MTPRTYVYVAAALIFSGGVAPAIAGTATGTGSAAIMRPLALAKTADLDFGTLAVGTTGGTAILDSTAGALAVTGGVTAVGTGAQRAAFTATGLANILAVIQLPTVIALTRSGGAQAMTITAVTTNGPALRIFPASKLLDIRVGGTLNVAAAQAEGSYTGSFAVTVIYL